MMTQRNNALIPPGKAKGEVPSGCLLAKTVIKVTQFSLLLEFCPLSITGISRAYPLCGSVFSDTTDNPSKNSTTKLTDIYSHKEKKPALYHQFWVFNSIYFAPHKDPIPERSYTYLHLRKISPFLRKKRVHLCIGYIFPSGYHKLTRDQNCSPHMREQPLDNLAVIKHLL